MGFVSIAGNAKWNFLFVVLNSICTHIPAQDSMRNSPELSLPLTVKKMVIAHCMTNIIRYKGHKFEDSCNPDYYSPTGNITSSIGGLTQVLPMEDSLLKDASLDSAVAFEMRAAMASGIDGFQFYYTLGNRNWDDIIKAYFRVAGKQNIDFKFTVCISHPSGSDEHTRIAEFGQRINNILDEVGRNNPHWLRTPDGRLIVYLWYGDGLADIPVDLQGLPAQYYIARAYKKLADEVGEKFACIFSINEQITVEKLNNCLDYFPACWIWTLPYTSSYIGNRIAAECKKRGRTFTGSTFCDFYTSKLLARGGWNIYNARDAAAAGPDKAERKYIVTGLSYNFRKLLEFGIAQEVPIMNIITWNDYPEGHHLAPEINHNEGFSILLDYYKSVWKDEPSVRRNKDLAIAFFKKYKHTIIPRPHDFKLVEIEKGVDPASEDSVEIITILTQPSVLIVNGRSVNVPAGFSDTKFYQAEGNVIVGVYRNQSTIIRFRTPEKITLHPYRTDRLTYSYSSEYADFYAQVFNVPLFSPINSQPN